MGIRRGSITTGIIADGLVFNMDAANRASYVEFNTTSFNTINTINTGSVENDAAVDSLGDPKGWDFDGVDSAIRCSNVGNDIGMPSEYTFEVWLKPTDRGTNANGIFGQNYARFTHNTYNPPQFSWNTYQTGGGGAYQGTPLVSLDIVDKWTHMVATYQTASMGFVNGTSHSGNAYYRTADGTIDVHSTADMNGTIGSYYYKDFGFANAQSGVSTFVGQIACGRVYNRALTKAEVLHNYNALKSRFE
tara:strand:- start:648 stop:1388 length:741 start_codon:yes stop_codon:yes gene_type:complete